MPTALRGHACGAQTMPTQSRGHGTHHFGMKGLGLVGWVEALRDPPSILFAALVGLAKPRPTLQFIRPPTTHHTDNFIPSLPHNTRTIHNIDMTGREMDTTSTLPSLPKGTLPCNSAGQSLPFFSHHPPSARTTSQPSLSMMASSSNPVRSWLRDT